MPIPLPSLPENNTTICLVIPDSPEWRQIYMGALQILAQWWYWQVENPEDSYDVIQRVMECAYLTGNNYEGCMELDCQDIIDCLNDPESGVLQTILDAVNSQSPSQLTQNSYNNKDLILGGDANPTCDKDILWGGIVNLVESANLNNVDALEILEVSTNQYEFLANVLTDILGVQVPVADAMLDWVVWLQQSILENYNAQITQEYLETIQCGLFCIAEETCELSPNDIYGYFADRVGATFTFDSAIADVLTYLVTGSWSGTEIADVMFMSQFAFRALVGQWFNFVAFNSVDLDFRLGMNNPDSDWSLLCTDCNEWTYEFDFITDNTAQGWTPYANRGVLNSTGWIKGSGLNEAVQIQRTFDTANLTSIEMFNGGLASGACGNKYLFRFPDVNGADGSWATDNSIQGMDISTDGVWVSLCVNGSTSITIQKIIFTGTGTNPFV